MRLETNPLWRRWEIDPPVFSVGEVTRRWKSHLTDVHRRGILKPTTPAADWWCEECDDIHDIQYAWTAGVRSANVVCEAGFHELPAEQTEQLLINTQALLCDLFNDARTNVQPIIGERLWTIGRYTIESRGRDLKFVRGIETRQQDDIIRHLAAHRKAVLFTPSSNSAQFWQSRVPCYAIAIEDVVASNAIDWDAIENQYINHHSTTEPVKVKKKRGTRSAKIERLRDELKRHLASAADHALATAQSEGCAALLPRPSKTELAKLAGMSKSDVTRCFTDSTASELRLLWDTADNLEAVLRLRGRSTWAE